MIRWGGWLGWQSIFVQLNWRYWRLSVDIDRFGRGTWQIILHIGPLYLMVSLCGAHKPSRWSNRRWKERYAPKGEREVSG